MTVLPLDPHARWAQWVVEKFGPDGLLDQPAQAVGVPSTVKVRMGRRGGSSTAVRLDLSDVEGQCYLVRQHLPAVSKLRLGDGRPYWSLDVDDKLVRLRVVAMVHKRLTTYRVREAELADAPWHDWHGVTNMVAWFHLMAMLPGAAWRLESRGTEIVVRNGEVVD